MGPGEAASVQDSGTVRMGRLWRDQMAGRNTGLVYVVYEAQNVPEGFCPEKLRRGGPTF